MANQLKMADVQSIVALHAGGWSRRRIARELGIDRETVGRYLAGAADSKPADALAGKEGADAGGGGGPNPAKALAGNAGGPGESGAAATKAPPGTPSRCEPWREVILAKLEQGLSAQRIYQDLSGEHGYGGSYHSVRRLVGKLGAGAPLPFRRMECEPGAEAQVDFGSGGRIVGPDGVRHRSHVLRVVLSHSRKGYSEAVSRQTSDDFLRCLENAFAHFGGVPRTLILDNLRAAVKRADWFEPELVPKVRAFAGHYGVAILPARPYTPRHKGKVERGIGYVKGNALKGRMFASLAEENRHLCEWEASVADRRIHGTTRRQVAEVFEQAERAALLPLPPCRFELFHEERRCVHRDGHVEIKRAYYSVPPEFLGQQVWVRWDGRVVRIFDLKMRQVALHAQQEAGRFSTHGQHIAAEKTSSVERGAAWLLERAGRIGPHARAWAEAVLEQRGVEGMRVLAGLNALNQRYQAEQIDLACEVAHGHQAWRLRVVRELLRRREPPQEQRVLPLVGEHPIIRPLADYTRLVPNAFTRQECVR